MTDRQRWREERPEHTGGAAPTHYGYELRLDVVERWVDADERYVVRLVALHGATSTEYERQLPRAVGERIVAELGPDHGTPRAEQALFRALVDEAAAAVGRQIERGGDLDAVPAVEELSIGHQRRIVAAARRAAAASGLPKPRPGELLRVGS